jgi:hypothetical protein
VALIGEHPEDARLLVTDIYMPGGPLRPRKSGAGNDASNFSQQIVANFSVSCLAARRVTTDGDTKFCSTKIR